MGGPLLTASSHSQASASSVSLIPRLDSDYGCFSAFCGGKILDARGLRLAILSDRVNAAQIPSDLLCKMTVEGKPLMSSHSQAFRAIAAEAHLHLSYILRRELLQPDGRRHQAPTVSSLHVCSS